MLQSELSSVLCELVDEYAFCWIGFVRLVGMALPPSVCGNMIPLLD